MTMISRPIPRQTVLLLQTLQHERDRVQGLFDVAVTAILATLELDGQVVSVDSDLSVLNVEVKE